MHAVHALPCRGALWCCRGVLLSHAKWMACGAEAHGHCCCASKSSLVPCAQGIFVPHLQKRHLVQIRLLPPFPVPHFLQGISDAYRHIIAPCSLASTLTTSELRHPSFFLHLSQGISDAYRHIIRAFLVHFHANIMRHSTKRFDYRGGSVGNFFFAGARIFFR